MSYQRNWIRKSTGSLVAVGLFTSFCVVAGCVERTATTTTTRTVTTDTSVPPEAPQQQTTTVERRTTTVP